MSEGQNAPAIWSPGETRLYVRVQPAPSSSHCEADVPSGSQELPPRTRRCSRRQQWWVKWRSGMECGRPIYSSARVCRYHLPEGLKQTHTLGGLALELYE